MVNKSCSKCHEEKESDEFPSTGYICKACKKSYIKQYKQNNKERVKEYNKSYYDGNREYLHIYEQNRYAKNREKKLEYQTKLQRSKTQHINGVLNPDIPLAFATITEHIVCMVLGNCTKEENLNAPYDLVSDKYGAINVKSSKPYKNPNGTYWFFAKNATAMIPSYYICLGFNETKSDIMHVWIIEGNSKSVKNRGIWIQNNKDEIYKYKQYEVDSIKYNKLYKTLDITTLPEFRNLIL
jgi:hypothetical protein